ncbi:S66 family peptidase [Candidatus Berkiella cookevillensis]|uniref:S66 family peptidase n=1 Tax=Candidatus Berkiella cookevillensis TaxID=437022 RepID=UPI00070F0297
MIPEKLVEGDQLRVIAPSRSLKIISEENINHAVNAIEALDLKVTFGKNVNEIDMMSSSSIASRIEDLHEAFSDKNVKAILTVIGGFNSNQLFRYIDYDLIKKNPKIFCGFSDITALQNAIYSRTGLITYSGPHFSTFGMKKGFEYSLDYFKKIFFQQKRIELMPSEQWADDAWFLNQDDRTFYDNEGYWLINEGNAKGTIVGGSLSTIQLLHGTSYMPSLENSILFIEADAITDGNFDVVEFDRDLQSLIHQPNFDKVQGILIGRFEKKFNMNLEQLKFIISSKQELRNIPIIANADFGHTMPIFTFPIGGLCEISASEENIKIELFEE